MTTLEDMAASALQRDPSLPAIEFGGRHYRWGDLQAVAWRVQALLDESGTPKHAPVAFVARNRPSAAAALLALIEQGRPIRMVFAFQSCAAIAAQLDRLQPAAALIMAEDDSAEMRAVLRERGIAAVVLDASEARFAPGCERSAPAWDLPAAPAEIHILTSGTTGPPKQFPVSYDLIAKHIVGGQSIPAPPSGETPPPPFLFYPIGNVTGLSTIIQVLIHGVPFILLDRFELRECMTYLRRYRPVALHLPPAAVQMVLDADVPAADFAGVRWIPTGAAPLHPEVQRTFEARYGIPILSSYGATEFAGAACVMTPEHYQEFGDAKFGSIGRPLPGIEIRVIDPETGEVLPPGREGIIEAKVARVGPDWIRTADLAVIDMDGFLFHRGRADGAITRGGFKVLPETIVTALLQHEAVSAAGVVGIADRRLGQVPAAVVQLRPGAARPEVAELERHLRDRVLATHVPAAWRFVDELPKNPSFKIDRTALKRLFDEQGDS
jgi:acyl-coenzyme A synthetase/AMP-(fatty) acid ligase